MGAGGGFVGPFSVISGLSLVQYTRRWTIISDSLHGTVSRAPRMARSPRTRRCGTSAWRGARAALGSPAECFGDGAEEREVWPSSLFASTSLTPERRRHERLS